MRNKATAASYVLAVLFGIILFVVTERRNAQCITECSDTSYLALPRQLWPRDDGKSELHDAHSEVADGGLMEEYIPNAPQPFPGFQQRQMNEFRASLIKKTNSIADIFATRQNIKQGETIHFAETKKWSFETETVKIPDFVYNVLPKESGLKPALFKSCSLVGNSGILTDSKCGRQIDSSHFVFRSNFPPVGGDYKEDVGSKTDLITINPSILVNYNKLESKEGRKRFIEDLAKYGKPVLYTHPFRIYNDAKASIMTFDTLIKANRIRQGRASHPDFLRQVALFWNDQGLQEIRPTTGFLLLAVSLSVCERVTLYGFWPFFSYNGQPINYHYYDRPILGTKVFADKHLEEQMIMNAPYHNFTEEFLFLNNLHDKGIIKLQVGECS